MRDLLISVAGPPGKNRPATEERGTCDGRSGDLQRKNRGPATQNSRGPGIKKTDGNLCDLRPFNCQAKPLEAELYSKSGNLVALEPVVAAVKADVAADVDAETGLPANSEAGCERVVSKEGTCVEMSFNTHGADHYTDLRSGISGEAGEFVEGNKACEYLTAIGEGYESLGIEVAEAVSNAHAGVLEHGFRLVGNAGNAQ